MQTEQFTDGDSRSPLTIGMMAKYWLAGHVKTRLAQAIGAEPAALIHREFTLFLCESLSQTDANRFLCLDPISRKRDVNCELDSRNLTGKWNLEEQADGDLGDRMSKWFDNHLRPPPDSTEYSVLIGCDSPLINSTHIESAYQGLCQADVVLGPARDGGYYLLGIRSTVSQEARALLFSNMQWSTHTVLSETRKRLRENGLTWHELSEHEDIDTIFDLRRLLKHVEDSRLSDPLNLNTARKTLLAKRIQSIVKRCPSDAKAILYDCC